MAFCKYPSDITPESSEVFDSTLEPSIAAPWPGIYQCRVCGFEIAVVQGGILPFYTNQHVQHEEPVRWRLSVFPGCLQQLSHDSQG